MSAASAAGAGAGRVMVVDDEPRMLEVVGRALERVGYEIVTADSGAQALERLDVASPDVVVTDWKMPGMDGSELLRQLHRQRPELPVILLTAHGSVPHAVAAMREGAFDYVTKPFDNDELRAVVARALEMARLTRENRLLREEVAGRYAPGTVVAESPRTRRLLELLRRVAPSRAAVLVQGESGTGKELVARLLHFWSDRVGKPFLAVNCKAFAEGVLESELFGHERGAFTGAVAARVGCFERAAGGTIFLDEIGETSVEFQAKLLRVLQESEVLPVGGSRPRRIDVRVVSATNRVLRDEIAAGRFREDLYFRLNVIPVELSPLRERREDVLPLARHFLARRNAESGRLLRLGTDAEAALLAHPWPGNVRELENAIERGAVLASGDEIAADDLLLEQGSSQDVANSGASDLTRGAQPPADSAAGAGATAAPGLALQERLDRATADALHAALAAAEGNRAEAARLLGVDRTTLYRLMRRVGL